VRVNESDPSVLEVNLADDSLLAPETAYTLRVSGVMSTSGNLQTPDPSTHRFITPAFSEADRSMTAVFVSGRLILGWPDELSLLVADDISGPWIPMPLAKSPMVLDLAEEVCPPIPRFYRSGPIP
jgi:hypothetical protein